MRRDSLSGLAVLLLATALVLSGLGSASAGVDSTPMYRFYSPSKGVHFFTADPGERDRIIATLGSVYSYEGVAYTIVSPDQVTAFVDEFVGALRTQVDALAVRLGAAEAVSASHATKIGTLEGAVAAQGARLGTAETNVTALQGRAGALESALALSDARITALEAGAPPPSAFWPVSADDMSIETSFSATYYPTFDSWSLSASVELSVTPEPGIVNRALDDSECLVMWTVDGMTYRGGHQLSLGKAVQPLRGRPAEGSPIAVEYWIERFGVQKHGNFTITGWTYTVR